MIKKKIDRDEVLEDEEETKKLIPSRQTVSGTRSDEIRRKYQKKEEIEEAVTEDENEASIQQNQKCSFSTRPFQIVLGAIFLLISLFIFISILMSSIDKAAYSLCGSKCGFIVTNPVLFNPLNSILTLSSRIFPLDYVIMASVVFYLLLVTIRGILRIGIRLFWMKLYDVKPHSTLPQALLLFNVTLMLSLLAFNINFSSMAPQYFIFGSQQYVIISLIV